MIRPIHLFCSIVLLAGISVPAFSAAASTIVVEGKYQNKNLYIQNSVSNSGVGFCAYEVQVNGQVSTDEVNSSAFEVDLSQYNLKFGDDVVIKIKHKDGCLPKVLNPEVLKPKPTFEIITFTAASDGIVKWKAKGETGSLPYIIEQYRWGKWVNVGEVQGKGIPGEHEYAFQVVLHSGENKFRLKQVGHTNQPKVSQSITIQSSKAKSTYNYQKSTITFSDETLFEVYDYYGTIVKKGFGKSIDMTNISKGGYYLCYDNIVEEFKKK
ncbi:MAG: hypothetical protein IT233_13370 [Bacteroidia bacterium]|nr:hypothetical protein [Bacteroidia bacterium]